MKKQLDERICDLVEGGENTETYREFIRNSEEEFGMNSEDIDNMKAEELNVYLNFLDYLCGK